MIVMMKGLGLKKSTFPLCAVWGRCYLSCKSPKYMANIWQYLKLWERLDFAFVQFLRGGSCGPTHTGCLKIMKSLRGLPPRFDFSLAFVTILSTVFLI